MATKLPNGKQQFLDPTTGRPLAGGKVWHYTPGTTNLKDTYQNSAGTIANTNPIVLDAYGSAVIWGNGAYRQVLFDASNNQIWDQETTSGISQAMEGVTSAATLALAKTALGISPAMQPVVGASSLADAMTTLGISPAMQPVVGAVTLQAARTAMGLDIYGFIVYNVKNYGAVGDGVTDDIAAIEAAITACNFGIVYFPPGSYSISRSIIYKPGVALWGASRLTSTITAGVANIKLVSYTATALTNAFEMLNLGFSANGKANVTAINLDGADAAKRLSLITLQNLYFAGGGLGIYLRFCANVTVFNCFANTTENGFWFDNCGDATWETCQSQNGAGSGFTITGGPGAVDEGIRFINCTTNGQGRGFLISGQEWGQIVGCSFTTCAIQAGAFINSSNWRITATDISSAGPVAGLTVDAACSSIQVIGNFFALNTFGLAMQGTRHVVSGNTFVANSNLDISLNNTSVVNVTGNMCDSNGVGFSIAEGGTANYSLITGNTCNGTIVLVGAQSVEANNLIY